MHKRARVSTEPKRLDIVLVAQLAVVPGRVCTATGRWPTSCHVEALEKENRLFKLAVVLSSSFVPNTVADQRPLCRAARCFNLAVPVAALSPLLLSSPPSWARIQSAPFNSFIHPIVSLSKSSSAGKGWRCGSDEQVWRKHHRAGATNAERIWWQRLDLFGSSPFLLFLQRQSYLT
jgi:hypothetical protein